jgi:hypothetical protein
MLAGLVGLGWAVQASATRLTPPPRCQGDPDEFQAKQIVGDWQPRLGMAVCRSRTCGKCGDLTKGGGRVSAATAGPAAAASVRITLGGQTYLWER